jgi:hypothetical protein
MSKVYRDSAEVDAEEMCECGSKEDLYPCMECQKPICPKCRAGFGTVGEYWHSSALMGGWCQMTIIEKPKEPLKLRALRLLRSWIG